MHVALQKMAPIPRMLNSFVFFLGAKSLNLKQNGHLCVSKVLSRYPGRRLKVLQTQSPLFTVSRTPPTRLIRRVERASAETLRFLLTARKQKKSLNVMSSKRETRRDMQIPFGEF